MNKTKTKRAKALKVVFERRDEECLERNGRRLGFNLNSYLKSNYGDYRQVCASSNEYYLGYADWLSEDIITFEPLT